VDELTELIASSHARWMPKVVEAIFGTNDPGSVAEALTEAEECVHGGVAGAGLPAAGAGGVGVGAGVSSLVSVLTQLVQGAGFVRVSLLGLWWPPRA
jgi:hypothetical protein